MPATSMPSRCSRRPLKSSSCAASWRSCCRRPETRNRIRRHIVAAETFSMSMSRTLELRSVGRRQSPMQATIRRRALNSPSRRAKASTEALLPGGHSCCHTLSGMSARGSNLLANREYSATAPIAQAVVAFRELRRAGRSALPAPRAELPPRTPIPFIRLCRPSANGRKPQRDSIASLTARQSSHASHAQRDVPPAVALKQMMHRSNSRETSHAPISPANPHRGTTATASAGPGKAGSCVAADPAILRTGCAPTIR